MKKISLFFTSLLFLAFTVQAHTPFPEDSGNYCNSRFDFCVTYPAQVFTVQYISDNDDGIYLRSENSEVEMTASGIQNVLGQDIRQIYNEILNELVVSKEQIIDHSTIFGATDVTSELTIDNKKYYLRTQLYDNYYITVLIQLNDPGFIPMEVLKEDIAITLNL